MRYFEGPPNPTTETAQCDTLSYVTKLLENDVRAQVESIDEQTADSIAETKLKVAAVEAMNKQVKDLKDGQKAGQAEFDSLTHQIHEVLRNH